jgi:hypothetical protein
VARATLGGVRFAVVHETGGQQGREQRAAAAYPDVDVLVFGHSHIPWDSHRGDRPAAAQPRLADRPAPQPDRTYLSVVAEGGALREVTLHRLGP